MNDPVDVLIIGAGASGAAVAWSLADTKMHILCLDQGGWMNPAQYPSTGRDWEAKFYDDWSTSPNIRGRPEDYPINDDNSPIKVVMWYISGNRDEDKIERADEFIVDRAKPRQHLAFGAGIHRCVGDRLAEQQLRILWEEILQRDLHFEITGPPQRLYSNFIRGIRSLPVRIVN